MRKCFITFPSFSKIKRWKWWNENA